MAASGGHSGRRIVIRGDAFVACLRVARRPCMPYDRKMVFRTLPQQALRLILLGLLLFALLPWGAYARPLGPTGAQAFQSAETVTSAIAPQSDAKATVARRCRGPALLGSSCGPDIGLVAVQAPLSAPGHTRPRWLATTQPLKGVVVFGPTDPPRSC